MKQIKYLSKCCNAPTYVNYGNEGTNYFICSKCHNPCNVNFDCISNPLDPNSLLNKELGETTAKDGSQRPNKDESYSCLSDTVSADHKWEEEFDKKFPDCDCADCIYITPETKRFKNEPTKDEIKDFIHSQLSKVIKERDEEWKKKIEKILKHGCDSCIGDLHEGCTCDRERIQMFYNLIKQGE